MAYDRINQVCLLILTAIALTVALIYTKTLAIPFTISLFIYSALSPVLKTMQRKWKLSKGFSVTITMLVFLIGATLTILFMVQSIQSFAKSAYVYRDRFIEFTELLIHMAQERGLPIKSNSIRSLALDLPFYSVISSFTGSLFSMIGNTLLIIIFVLFLLFGNTEQTAKHPVFDEIELKISQYTLAKIFISAATGISAAILMYSLNIELVLMFSLLTFLLNFIPSIGSMIAVLLPIPLVLLQYGFGLKFYLLLIIFTLIQFIWGNVVEPKMMGETLDLHPITILLSLLFWGLVWGVPGMFLAVPITAALKIIMGRIEATKPVSEIMAGRIDLNNSK